jgi:hypothetical protein
MSDRRGMRVFIAAVACAALLGVAAWRLLGGDEGGATPSPSSFDATRDDAPSPGVAASRVEGGAPIPAVPFEDGGDASRTPSSKVAQEGFGELSVRAVWDFPETPAAGVRAWFLGEADQASRNDFATELPSYIADEEGRFPTLSLPAPRTELRTDRGSVHPLGVYAGRRTEVVIRIPPGPDLVVRVETTEGAPIADAEVWTSANRSRMRSIVGRTSGDGTLNVVGLRTPVVVAIRAAGFQCSEARELSPNFKSEDGLRFRLPRGGGQLVGVVRYSDGRPVDDAVVEARSRAEAPASSPQENVEVGGVPAYATRVDREGRFAFPMLSAGPCELDVRSGRALDHFAEVEIPAGGAASVELVLTQGGSVEGAVYDATGGLVAGAKVEVRSAPDAKRRFFKSAVARPDGGYFVGGVPPGGYIVIASKKSLGSVAVTTSIDADTPRRVDLRLDRGRVVSGRVVHRGGVPMETGRVTAKPLVGGRSDARTSLAPNGDGAFAFEFEDASPVRLEVEDDLWRTIAVVERATPGDPPLLVTVDSPPHDAYATARFLDAEKKPVPGVFLGCRPFEAAQGGKWSLKSGSDGRATAGPMPSGSYAITGEFLGSDGKVVVKDFGRRDVLAGETLDLGDVVIEPPGILHVIVLDPDGKAPTDCLGSAYRVDAGEFRRVAGWSAAERHVPLAAGSYVAMIQSREPEFAPVDRRFDIQPGVLTKLEIRLDAERDAVCVVRTTVVDARNPNIAADAAHARVGVLSSDGLELTWYRSSLGTESGLGMRQGRLRLRAELADGRFAESVVDVPPPSQPELKVEIRVP